ncbi:phage tail tube protein [Hahella ganghwensis]|uniref:phage tail tube protein n=1 Tax=Hahella ganghwensis TaxID=286420 RepID=UPI000360AB28|nr:phage tail tube protein [Hahella ganghwensis]
MSTYWSGVGVAMQSAIATAVAISAISKASPGVVTHAGADPSDGDIVLVTAQGMSQVNARLFRVANAAAGSFELEGEDTSDYDDFSSGTFQVVTFGTTFSTFTDVNASGGEPEYTDTTTIHQKQKTQAATSVSPSEFSFTSHWSVSDPALLAAKAASNTNAERAFRITFPSGEKVYFYGTVSAALNPGGSAQGLVTTNVSISASGVLTGYAS